MKTILAMAAVAAVAAADLAMGSWSGVPALSVDVLAASIFTNRRM